MSDTFRVITSTTVGPDAPALHTEDPKNDVRYPARYTAVPDSVLERTELPSYSGFTAPAFGAINAMGSAGTFRFETNDRVCRCWLNITVGAIGTTGVNTYKRLVDYAGARMATYDWRYRNKSLHRQQPMEQFINTQLCMNNDNRFDYAEEFGGNLSPAARSTRALAQQNFLVPIPSPWMYDETQSPIMTCLSEPLELVVQLGSIGDIVETDDNSPATVSLAIVGTPTVFYERQVDTTGQRSVLASLVQNSIGIENLFKDFQYQNLGTVLVGATEMRNIRIDNLRREGATLFVLVRPSTYTTAFAGTYFDFDNAYLPRDVQLNMSEGDIVPLQPVAHLQRRNYQRLFTARQYPIIPLAFCEDFESKQQCSGSLDFSNVKNGTLTLVWSAPLTVALNVEVVWASWNFMQQQGTELQRVSS